METTYQEMCVFARIKHILCQKKKKGKCQGLHIKGDK